MIGIDRPRRERFQGIQEQNEMCRKEYSDVFKTQQESFTEYLKGQRDTTHSFLSKAEGAGFDTQCAKSQEFSLDGTPKTELSINPKTNVTAFATKFVLTLSKLLNNNVTNN